MWNNSSNGPGFSSILGKISRKGVSPVTEKANFEPINPASTNPHPQDFGAKIAALNGLAGMHSQAFPMPKPMAMPAQGSLQKDKYLGWLKSGK